MRSALIACLRPFPLFFRPDFLEQAYLVEQDLPRPYHLDTYG